MWVFRERQVIRSAWGILYGGDKAGEASRACMSWMCLQGQKGATEDS